MLSKSRKHNRSAGFSLVEVLVALVIAVMMGTAIARFVIGTRWNARRVGETLEMTTLGETLLGRLQSGKNWTPGRSDGRSGVYAWRIDVTPLAFESHTRIRTKKEAPKDPKTAQNENPTQEQMGFSAFRLEPSSIGADKGNKPATIPAVKKIKWIVYRVAVTVTAPSGHRYATDTIRVGQNAEQ